MSTSLSPVTIPENTWVDLYAATGILAGTQLIVQNTGSSEAALTESATLPTLPFYSVGYNLLPVKEFFTNASGNVGGWAFSSTGTTLQVEEA